MIDIEQIKRECYLNNPLAPSDRDHEVDGDVKCLIDDVIDYLQSRGYFGVVWQPIETALKDCCIDTIGTIQTHHGKKVKVRVTDDYMSSNSPYPLTTTYFEHPNGLTGTYTREAWMPLPAAPDTIKKPENVNVSSGHVDAVKVPDGYVLVPKEPTVEIIKAMEYEYNHDMLPKSSNGDYDSIANDMRSAYKAIKSVVFPMTGTQVFIDECKRTATPKGEEK